MCYDHVYTSVHVYGCVYICVSVPMSDYVYACVYV